MKLHTEAKRARCVHNRLCLCQIKRTDVAKDIAEFRQFTAGDLRQHDVGKLLDIVRAPRLKLRRHGMSAQKRGHQFARALAVQFRQNF